MRSQHSMISRRIGALLEAAIDPFIHRFSGTRAAATSLAVALSLLATTGYCTATGPAVTEINVTRDTSHRWGEPEVAVNPLNPNNIVYASVGLGNTADCLAAGKTDNTSPCSSVTTNFGPQPRGLMDNVQGFSIVTVWVSMDGGKTWKRAAETPTDMTTFTSGLGKLGMPGDPLLTVGRDGTFYLGWDANHFNPNLTDNIVDYGVIGVVKSTDGGLTWSPTGATGTPVDRPWFTSDLVTGDIYAASSGYAPGPLASGDPTTPEQGQSGRQFVRLTNPGDPAPVMTWTQPHPALVSAQDLGLVASAAFGKLAVAFETTSDNQSLCGKLLGNCLIFQTSTDAGATWEPHVVPTILGGTPTGMVMVAADPSRAGHFAVAYPTRANTAFSVYRTGNGGATWQGPTTVTDHSLKAYYHTWMAYSPNGVLGLMWQRHSQRGLPSAYTVWAAISKNDGATFSQPLQVSSAESPAPDTSSLIGYIGDDFSYIALSTKAAYVAWADWRPTPADNPDDHERSGYLGIVPFDSFTFK